MWYQLLHIYTEHCTTQQFFLNTTTRTQTWIIIIKRYCSGGAAALVREVRLCVLLRLPHWLHRPLQHLRPRPWETLLQRSTTNIASSVSNVYMKNLLTKKNNVHSSSKKGKSEDWIWPPCEDWREQFAGNFQFARKDAARTKYLDLGGKLWSKHCPMQNGPTSQIKASSAKIVAHRGSKFEVDRCHQLSSPVISCQYFHHLLLERPESWWWCNQLLKGTGWWVTMMYKITGCFLLFQKNDWEKKFKYQNIFRTVSPPIND